MAAVYTSLAPNQERALHEPCRKCGALPLGPDHRGSINLAWPNWDGQWSSRTGMQKRIGRYGPWVECKDCGEKVYRPRGRGWKPYPPVTKTVVESYKVETLPIPLPTPATTVQVTATEEQVRTAVSSFALPVLSKLTAVVEQSNSKAEQANIKASLALGNVERELALLKAAQPVVIEIRTAESVKTVQDAHFLMPRLLKLLGEGLNVYLWGEPGSGKTTAAMQASEALGMGSEVDTLDRTTFRSMIQGFISADGQRQVHTSFTRCWSEGLGYIADEADNAPGNVQTLFNSALANGHAPLAWGNVERHPKFVFIGTGNTPGRPTRQFPDRQPMSAAFADRLYFMYWPIDPAIECRAVGLPIPPRPELAPIKVSNTGWVTWVRKMRDWASVNMPTMQVTPRASLTGLQALALGEHPLDVAHGLVFRGADSEMVSKALHACPIA